MAKRKPMILVCAGPNGSGESTITRKYHELYDLPGIYINADQIKLDTGCTDLEAAQQADRLRNEAIENK